MNKSQLIDKVASFVHLNKVDCEKILDSAIKVIKENVQKGNSITIMGFGTFTTLKRGRRISRNPKNGEIVKVPAKSVPKFRPSKAFLKALN